MSKTETQVPPDIIKLAYKFGMLREGYSLEDYLILAILIHGYETIILWGVQGSGKSSFLLQILFWIYRFVYVCEKGYIDPEEYRISKRDFNAPAITDEIYKLELSEEQENEIWIRVLDAIIFKPAELVERLEPTVDGEKMIPGLGWDDILVHYPASKFKTDIKEYEAVDEVWAAIRTGVSVMATTLPVIDRLAKNIKDNATVEIFIGRNQLVQIRRIFRLPKTDDIGSNLFKPRMEKPRIFDMYFAPQWVWDRYWMEMRIPLTRQAVETLRGVTDMDDMEGYIPVKEAAKHSKLNPNSIQQMISRSVYRGRKAGGLLHINIDDFNEYLEIKGKPPLEVKPHVSIDK